MTPDLEREVHFAFGADGGAAVEVLSGYQSDAQDAETNRVRRAVLALAKGDLARLRHFTERARQDFRDVLFWAENSPDADEPRTYSELRARLGLPPDPEHPDD